MSKSAVSIRQPKARGEWAELRFMTRAAEFGLRVTKPCVVILRSALFARRRTWARRADILAFFARMRGSRVWRASKSLPTTSPSSTTDDSTVQVKSTCKKRLQSYVCTVSNHRGPYTHDQIDFLAAYIIPTETWYILPVAALHHAFDIWLNPNRKNSRYAEFKEAWHLLKR